MNFKSMITTSVVALSLATTAMADSNISGFYLGGNLGYGTGTGKLKSSTEKKNIKVKGPVFGVHMGYQRQIDMFFMAIEGKVDVGNTKKTSKNGNDTLTVKRDRAIGLATRLGVVVKDVIFYTKLGWENANFNLKAKSNVGSVSKNKRLNGFVAGLGTEKVFSNGIMLGGEWTVTKYKKLTSPIVADSKLSTRIHDFKIRLGYKF